MIDDGFMKEYLVGSSKAFTNIFFLLSMLHILIFALWISRDQGTERIEKNSLIKNFELSVSQWWSQLEALEQPAASEAMHL